MAAVKASPVGRAGRAGREVFFNSSDFGVDFIQAGSHSEIRTGQETFLDSAAMVTVVTVVIVEW